MSNTFYIKYVSMQYFGFMINKNYNTFECKRMGSHIFGRDVRLI